MSLQGDIEHKIFLVSALYIPLVPYVGMGGGKGTVTPLLKGNVRIPPPAGHFIDPPLSQEKFLLTPLCSEKNFSIVYLKINKKSASKMQNYNFLKEIS